MSGRGMAVLELPLELWVIVCCSRVEAAAVLFETSRDMHLAAKSFLKDKNPAQIRDLLKLDQVSRATLTVVLRLAPVDLSSVSFHEREWRPGVVTDMCRPARVVDGLLRRTGGLAGWLERLQEERARFDRDQAEIRSKQQVIRSERDCIARGCKRQRTAVLDGRIASLNALALQRAAEFEAANSKVAAERAWQARWIALEEEAEAVSNQVRPHLAGAGARRFRDLYALARRHLALHFGDDAEAFPVGGLDGATRREVCEAVFVEAFAGA